MTRRPFGEIAAWIEEQAAALAEYDRLQRELRPLDEDLLRGFLRTNFAAAMITPRRSDLGKRMSAVITSLSSLSSPDPLAGSGDPRTTCNAYIDRYLYSPTCRGLEDPKATPSELSELSELRRPRPKKRQVRPRKGRRRR